MFRRMEEHRPVAVAFGGVTLQWKGCRFNFWAELCLFSLGLPCQIVHSFHSQKICTLIVGSSHSHQPQAVIHNRYPSLYVLHDGVLKPNIFLGAHKASNVRTRTQVCGWIYCTSNIPSAHTLNLNEHEWHPWMNDLVVPDASTVIYDSAVGGINHIRPSAACK